MTYLDHINEKFPVRRTAAEKRAFQSYAIEQASAAGMKACIESNGGKNENIVIGDPLAAKAIFTAHYDTPCTSIFPNIMIPRCLPLFWLYQFLPVVLILAVSLAAAFLPAKAMELSRQQSFAIFLVMYYGLYFLLFRSGKNPRNRNDNTSGVAAVMTLLSSLEPEEQKSVAFILFDNEEKGKKGSKVYFADHKAEMESRLLINFDCVGNGENFIFVAMEKAEKHPFYPLLAPCFGESGDYRSFFFPKKGSESNSDYKNFPCGVGCMACRRSKGGIFYTPRIHTPRDTEAKNENIEYLKSGIKRFIAALAAHQTEESTKA